MKRIGHLSWLMLIFFYILLISINRLNAASYHELSEELRFVHREISLLRDENHHQNMEIALLKERVGSTKEFDDRALVSHLPNDNFRYKRPARLLPPHILYGERKNETEQQKHNSRRRYEQPTNCSDLSLLGYTLNGFYMVKSNESSIQSNSTNNDIKLETVYCAFKQPEGTFNSTLVEKRIISRREATKPKPQSKIIFVATRETDLEASDGTSAISFQNVLGNSGDALNEIAGKSYYIGMGRFTVPQSGVYLFVFRGIVTFPKHNEIKEFNISIFGHKKSTGRNRLLTLKNIGDHTVLRQDISANVEFDKMLKLNRGETIYLKARFNETGAKFSGNSTSFTAYLIDE